MRARRTRARTCCVRARARVCVCDRACTHPRRLEERADGKRLAARTWPRVLGRHMRARSVGVDRGWLGSQAFTQASAFNANIGAWNIAAVTSLSMVCAAISARAARHCWRDALGRDVDVARAVVRGGDRRCALVCVYADVWARACAGVHVCRYSCA